MTHIQISWNSGRVIAELKETPTTHKLIAALPCVSRTNTWGEEVYFKVPIQAELDKEAQQVVEPGTVCFWAQGQSLAIPFGPTPISKPNECRLVTKVNILGKVVGDLSVLKSVRDGMPIKVELVRAPKKGKR